MDILDQDSSNSFESFFNDEDFGGIEAQFNRVTPAGVLVATLISATSGMALFKMKNDQGAVIEEKRPVFTLVHRLESHIKAAAGEKKLEDVEVAGLKLTSRVALISKIGSDAEKDAAIKLYKARAAAVLATHGVDNSGSGQLDEFLQQAIGAQVELTVKSRADKRQEGVFYKEVDLFTKGAVKYLQHVALD